MDSAFSTQEGPGDSLLAELLAVKNGLHHAWHMGTRSVLCESDSYEVVSLLNGVESHIYHVYAGIIEEILSLVHRQWAVQFGHVLREANMCADFLAKEAWKMSSSSKEWKDHPPLMGSLLLQDMLGSSV